MKPSATDKSGKICRRCHRITTHDVICPACKNELIVLYDNKLSWRTAFEVERISRKAMLYSRNVADDELY